MAVASTPTTPSSGSRRFSSCSPPGLCNAKIVQLLPCVHTDGQQVVADPALASELEWEHQRIQRLIEGIQGSLRVLEGVIATTRSHSP